MRATRTAIVVGIALWAFGGSAQENVETQVSIGSLDVKQQRIVAISASAATGDMPQLSVALSGGLDAGLTVNEIKEILIQLYAYAGFPRSLNGLGALESVLEERSQRGITDDLGAGPRPFPLGTDSAKLGTEIQLRLTGAVASEKYADFSPAIDTFLKAHLFGDIFGRDNLDFRTRELVTVSALAALDGVEAQLQSHLRIAQRQGLTSSQLGDVVAIIASTVGQARADRTANALRSVLADASAGQPTRATAVNETGSATERSIQVVRGRRAQSETAPPEHFVGVVRVERSFQARDPARASGAYVTFGTGARTAWHSHPLGQTLVVTAGIGWVQEWGKQAQEIRKGDVVWIPPGVKHWHGAAASTRMTHLAIQEQVDGQTVTWMEQVGEGQYREAGATPRSRR
jgi:alkylhydroperoxidase/carboxymuconolactone decarboxylase family protein YurZ/quercetin dioxygenase-like cupin family protein